MEKARIPCIPLDYKNRDVAIQKELVFDYDLNKLYVVDSINKRILHDVTQAIAELVKNEFNGNSITINIEGIGVVKLDETIKKILDGMVDFESPDKTQYLPTQSTDLNSIVVLDNKLSIVGFKSAGDGTIPQKINGVINWVNPDPNQGITINQITPNPGATLLNLTINRYNKTTQLAGDFNIEFVGIPLEYTKTVLYCSVGDTVPLLHYPDCIAWEFSDAPTLESNSINILTFESWDGGNTFLGSVKKFLNVPEQFISETYVRTNLYTKTEIEELLAWKTIPVEE